MDARSEAPLIRESFARQDSAGCQGSCGRQPRVLALESRSELVPIGFEGRDVRSNQPPLSRDRASHRVFSPARNSSLRGRLFNDQDNDKAPLVAVVNDAFAAPTGQRRSLGKRIKLDTIQLDGSRRPGARGRRRRGCPHRIAGTSKCSAIYRCSIRRWTKIWRFPARAPGLRAIPQQVRGQVQSINPSFLFRSGQALRAVSGSLAQRRFS